MFIMMVSLLSCSQEKLTEVNRIRRVWQSEGYLSFTTSDLEGNPIENSRVYAGILGHPRVAFTDTSGKAIHKSYPDYRIKYTVTHPKYDYIKKFDSLWVQTGDTLFLNVKIDTSKKMPLLLSTTEISKIADNFGIDSALAILPISVYALSYIDTSLALKLSKKWLEKSRLNFKIMDYTIWSVLRIFKDEELGEIILDNFKDMHIPGSISEYQTTKRKSIADWGHLDKLLKILFFQKPEGMEAILQDKFDRWDRLASQFYNIKSNNSRKDKDNYYSHERIRVYSMRIGLTLEMIDSTMFDKTYLDNINRELDSVSRIKREPFKSDMLRIEILRYKKIERILPYEINSMDDVVGYDPNSLLDQYYDGILYPIVYNENKGVFKRDFGYQGSIEFIELLDGILMKYYTIRSWIA